jgi:hypothetical protein
VPLLYSSKLTALVEDTIAEKKGEKKQFKVEVGKLLSRFSRLTENKVIDHSQHCIG